MKNLRLTLVGTTAALAVALAPAAQASPSAAAGDVYVCNQASPSSLGGNLDAIDPATSSPAARYTTDLQAKPGNGKGLVNAAAHSPALTLCAAPAETINVVPTVILPIGLT